MKIEFAEKKMDELRARRTDLQGQLRDISVRLMVWADVIFEFHQESKRAARPPSTQKKNPLKKKKKPVKKKPTKKKKSPQVGRTISSYVREAMSYMHPEFSSTALMLKVYELAKDGPYKEKQLKTGVHGFLFVASTKGIKDNPYPIERTGKKDLRKNMIYRRWATKTGM